MRCVLQASGVNLSDTSLPAAVENRKRRKVESIKAAVRRSSRRKQPAQAADSALTAETAVVASNVVIDGIEPFEPTPAAPRVARREDPERACAASREVLPMSPDSMASDDEAEEYNPATCPVSMLLFALEDSAREPCDSHAGDISNFILQVQTALEADGGACGTLDGFLREVSGAQSIPRWLEKQRDLRQAEFKLLVQDIACKAREFVAAHNFNQISSPECDLSQGYRDREAEYAIAGDVMGDLTDSMWSILVDWIIEVQVNYNLSQETLFLSVDILSRYIRTVYVSRSDLQLVGAASLLIASKYEEIYPPQVDEFVYICASTYSRKMLLRAELQILQALDYKLASPLAWHFLNWVSKRVQFSDVQQCVAEFFLESTLQESTFQKVPRSLVAAAAVDLAGRIMQCPEAKMERAIRLSAYERSEVIDCARRLNDLLLHRNDHREDAVYKNWRQKYAHRKHHKVGALPVTQQFYD